LNCPKCGAQLPDDATFCYKCGTKVSGQPSNASGAGTQKTESVIAPHGAVSLKCPSCGAPIAPKFGEMVITCEYCGSSVTLGDQGWTGIQKQTMLPIKLGDADKVNAMITSMMDKGLLHRHLHEDSTQEEMNLSYVPYWIVGVSARTTVVATNMAAQVGQTATTAALMGVILGGMGGGFGGGGFGRRAFKTTVPTPHLPSGLFLSRWFKFYGMGMGYGGGMMKTEQMDENYNFPVVALKALTEYQPRDYQFSLEERTLFDISKIPKNVKVLNGDIGGEVAQSQAKTLVDQLQSEKAHAKYHMIQKLTTDSDVGDVELLHAPIWFARYDHKGKKIVLVFDANSGNLINSLGL
jgi:DNA-directed RNA polymerase subunit RPC12/RpoP